MTRVGPTFGTPAIAEHEVSNNWGVNGDTPGAFRIYPDPFDIGQHFDVGVGETAYEWTGLPSGTLMNFSVSCLYQDPAEELSASFPARTAGTPSTPPTHWRGPETLATGMLGRDFAACSWGPGRIDLFSRANNGHLMHRWYANGWYPEEDLGGNLPSNPAACCGWSGRIDVFYIGQSGHMLHRWWNGEWSEEEDYGGDWIRTSCPGVASPLRGAAGAPPPVPPPDRIDVFARGTNFHLWHMRYEQGWPEAWRDLGGGELLGDPTAVSWGGHRVDVFYPSSQNSYLGHRWSDDGDAWSAEEILYRGEGGAPGAPASWGANRIDLFCPLASGSTLALGHRWWDGARWNEEYLGDRDVLSCAAASWGSGRLDAFYVTGDGQLKHRWYS